MPDKKSGPVREVKPPQECAGQPVGREEGGQRFPPGDLLTFPSSGP